MDESNQIMHEINSIYPIMGNVNENYISLAVCRDGNEFYINGKKIDFLNSRVKLCIENNLDGTISIKCGGRYLSARPNGRCALVPDNDKWEHFVVV